jgi:predicted dehydrogenase
MQRQARYAVVGLGTWGEMLARALADMPGVDLAAVCDINEARARWVAQSTGTRMYYTDFSSLTEDESITAVVVATPDHQHLEAGLAAARAGKHLLVEKPLATTVEEAQLLVDAVKQAGVLLMVNFYPRWHPAFATARQAIEDGRLGVPNLLSCRWNHTLDLPTRGITWPTRTSAAWCGGSYAVDLMRWLTGDEVIRVSATSGSRILDGMGLATPDFFVATLEFARGAVGTVEMCWTLPPGGPTEIDVRGEVIGTEGTIYFDLSHNRTIEQYGRVSVGFPIAYPDLMTAPAAHGHRFGPAIEALRHFTDCVLLEREPMVNGEDGLAATRIVAAIHESARNRQPVVLSLEEKQVLFA